MKLVKVTEDIFKYEDFISLDEANAVIRITQKMLEADPLYWHSISFYESYSAGYPEDGDPLLKEVGLSDTFFSDTEQKMRECASEVARVDQSKMSKISFHLQRWLPGAYAPKHSDNSSNNGVEGAFTRSRYAGFLYLNDDFEGGVLKFYADGGKNIIEVKPEIGTFWVFHGGYKNMHEVELVKKSTRYTLGSFWDDREESDYPQEIRDIWAKELEDVRSLQKKQSVEWQEIRDKGLVRLLNGEEVPQEDMY